MIILRNEPKILMPVPKSEWRTPSQSREKDHMGNEHGKTWFSVIARLHDGHKVWTGRFEDRDDADAFLYAIVLGTINQQPALWDLPTPSWYPGLGEELTYYFVTNVILTSTTATSYTIPAGWGDGNLVHCIGGGGGGGAGRTYNSGGGGGGGGAYARKAIIGLTAGSSVSIKVGAAGGKGGSSSVSGTAGTDTWFDGTSVATSSVGAKAGGGGGSGDPGPNYASGGQASASVGTTKYSGGTGGRRSYGGGGGAGAGGYYADGNNGSNANQAVGGTGGRGDGTYGGVGGVGGDSSPKNGTAGSAGTELEGTVGSGGGGGGGGGDSYLGSGAAGGAYGAGGGGGGQSTTNSLPGGDGTQGLILVQYGLPVGDGSFFMFM